MAEPIFKILRTERGGGYTAPDVLTDSSGFMVFAGIRQVFNPRITNKSAIDIFIRPVGSPGWPSTPAHTVYPNHKADSVNLRRDGRELQVFCGTHITDQPLDANGARDFYIEKTAIADVFPE